MAAKTQCPRCGHEIDRWGKFRDGDYLELLHDYFALEARERAALRDCAELRETTERLHFLVQHLVAPSPEQIELMGLRAQLAELVPAEPDYDPFAEEAK